MKRHSVSISPLRVRTTCIGTARIRTIRDRSAAIGALALSALAFAAVGCSASRPAAAPDPRAAPAAGAHAARATFRHVVVISVDGLRSDALIALPRSELRGFARLSAGAWTLNARTDPDWTVTLPNHTAMMTGRFVEGDDGHAWTKNGEPPRGATLASNRGAYVAGIFDVAHDRGFQTALFSGKTKFSLYDVSWDGEHGAPDVTGEDDGRDKLDRVTIEKDMTALVDATVAWLSERDPRRRLVFLHLAAPDLTGHAHGWDVTPDSRYMNAVREADRAVERVLDAIESSPDLAGSTAVVLTADHGGGAPRKSHDQPHMWIDYVIPFFVWTGADARADSAPSGARDLYALNTATRADPGLWQVPRRASGLPPIRNGDAGNCALGLLGLPPVPGSRIGVAQDLVVDVDGRSPRHPWPGPLVPRARAPDPDDVPATKESK